MGRLNLILNKWVYNFVLLHRGRQPADEVTTITPTTFLQKKLHQQPHIKLELFFFITINYKFFMQCIKIVNERRGPNPKVNKEKWPLVRKDVCLNLN